MKNKSLLVKLIIGGVVASLLVGVYIFDATVANQYHFELVAQSDDTVIADGVSSVRFRVLVSKDGEPVVGHKIYLFASNGSLPNSRILTNESGLITFIYYPYLYVNDKVTPLEDVTITLQNESNSYFFMVPATWKFSIPVEKPTDTLTGVDWENLSASD